jgi:hypothetical protein
MNSVYDTIFEWARKTTTSFAELRRMSWDRDDMEDEVNGSLIYRLTRWPDLPSQTKTAGVLRALSVMTSRPVNRTWIIATSKLRPEQVDRLLQRLVDEEAVQVIDGSKFPPADFA